MRHVCTILCICETGIHHPVHSCLTTAQDRAFLSHDCTGSFLSHDCTGSCIPVSRLHRIVHSCLTTAQDGAFLSHKSTVLWTKCSVIGEVDEDTKHWVCTELSAQYHQQKVSLEYCRVPRYYLSIISIIFLDPISHTDNVYKLTGMSKAERPQSQIWSRVWDTAKAVLNGVNTLMNKHLAELKLQQQQQQLVL